MPVVGNNYVSSQKARICKSAFISKKFNLRRLESTLHPIFQEICHDLTRQFPNLIPHLHDTLWLSWDDEMEDFEQCQGRKHLPFVDDDDDNDHISDEDSDDPKNELANSSFESDKTLAGRDVEGIPDLVIHHARTSYLEGNSLHIRQRSGVKLHHFCPFLISEFKTGVERGLPAEDIEFELALQFAEAYRQLARYLVWVFAAHPYLDEIIAMPVAGIYWYYVPVKRTSMPPYDWSTQEFLAEDEVTKLLGKKAYFEVCTPESDTAFTQLLTDYFIPLRSDNSPLQG